MTKKTLYVVGVGASAGGLEAIHEFFDHFPSDSNLSFVIVQHLSSDYKSLLAELIAKHTQMKVLEAEDDMLIKPNCIYVIPNRKLMTIKQLKLRLKDKVEGHVPNNAIDVFFYSLAEEMKGRGIGVILSGTGSDGTKGLEAIKKAGGFNVVQDPTTAKFDGMPASAISSGYADVTGAPKEMSEMILRFLKEGLREKVKPLLSKYPEETFGKVLELVKNQTYQDFSHYKKPTILRRIEKRMLENHVQKLDDYYNILRESPAEVEKLSKDFLIGVTKFFRDREAFEVVQEKVIPAICSKKEENDVLKIWVTACSMGEEAYSIAIMVCEHLERNDINLNVKIFASDIDKEAIEYASKGRYPLHIANEVSPERLEKFFTKEKDYYCVTPHLRKMVIFAQHDITKDPPFSRMDMISCRNLLIYLDPFLQNKVLSSFNFSLNLSGYLFLGSSENPGDLKPDLYEIDKKYKIYQKARASSKPNVYSPEGLNFKPYKVAGSSGFKAQAKPKIADIFAESLVEEFGSAGVIVDHTGQIIQGIGDYTKFLHLPEKDLSFNLLKMVPEDISYVIGSGIRKAIHNQKKVSSKVRIRKKKSSFTINIIIKPLEDISDSSQKLIFILFNESRTQTDSASNIEFINKATESTQRMSDLEEELKETKQNLQSVVEELETSNEELQSSNEELISANEELQSTNEELQSLNEELHTVNTEHQLKIKELIELNDDLDNFFRSTDIGQIFIGGDMSIRKFTPSSKDLINLIESDIGRPISHISNNIKSQNIISDIHEVISNSQIIEKEVELKNGKYYLTRILPYIRQDKRTDGVVITFVDITDLKNLNGLLSGILNSSTSGIMALKPIYGRGNKITDFEFIMVNQSIEQLLGRTELTGKRLLNALPNHRETGLFEKYVNVIESGQILHLEYKYEKGDEQIWFESVAVKMNNGIAVTVTDINEKKQAEERRHVAIEELKKVEERLLVLNNELEERVKTRTQELAQSEERFRLISQATNDAIWDWNLVTNKRWWNEGFTKIFGYENGEEDSGIEEWIKRIHPEDKDRVVKSIYDAINYGSRLWAGEYKFQKADGAYAYILDRGEVLHNENGVPYRMLGSMVDLTETKKAEQVLYDKNRELVKINELLDTFVYTAAHDLKSPVANLKILVDLLLEKGEAGRKELLKAIELSIKRLDNTINGLVEIVETRSYDISKVKRLFFQDIVNRILEDYKDQLKQCDGNIETDFSGCDSIVYIEAYLFSIMNNLISNAIKYCSSERRLKTKIKSYKENEYIVLEIEDNGIGMDLERYGKNLFKPFNRFAKHIDGTGIGLYLIKNMVENNDGKIIVKSKINEGTKFIAYLKEYNQEG